MAITGAICDSYWQEVFQGTHSSADTYNLALYTSAAALDRTTSTYTTTGEASGTGYTSGGTVLSGFTWGKSGNTNYLNWTSTPTWSSATITARGALIWNTSKQSRAVCVLDFGADISSTASVFAVTLPPSGSTAVVTVGG